MRLKVLSIYSKPGEMEMTDEVVVYLKTMFEQIFNNVPPTQQQQTDMSASESHSLSERVRALILSMK